MKQRPDSHEKSGYDVGSWLLIHLIVQLLLSLGIGNGED